MEFRILRADPETLGRGLHGLGVGQQEIPGTVRARGTGIADRTAGGAAGALGLMRNPDLRICINESNFISGDIS